MSNNQTAPAILATDEKAALGGVTAPRRVQTIGQSWWSVSIMKVQHCQPHCALHTAWS